jgi:membrane protein implicated in regulation of membrane protease activity
MRGSGLVTAMSVVRSVVYFCLGFGPVGLFAMTQYGSPATTLLWSVPVGAVVMVGTRLLRRLASREISSDVSSQDLLMERGVVTVSIGKGQMGKVRVTIGGSYVDWYARCKGETSLKVGTRIRVVDATDECVYVEEE